MCAQVARGLAPQVPGETWRGRVPRPASAGRPRPGRRPRPRRRPLRPRAHLLPSRRPPARPGGAGPARATGAGRDAGRGEAEDLRGGAGARRAVRRPSGGTRRSGRPTSRPRPRAPPRPRAAPARPRRALTSAEAARIPSGPRWGPRPGWARSLWIPVRCGVWTPEPSRAPRGQKPEPPAAPAREERRAGARLSRRGLRVTTGLSLASTGNGVAAPLQV